MKKFTVVDIESHWNADLHEAFRFVEDGGSSRNDTDSFYRGDARVRTAARSIHVAGAFDFTLHSNGQVDCERIASWDTADLGSEKAVISALFTHIRGRPEGTSVVGYGSVASDLPILTLAAMEYGLLLPKQFLPSRLTWAQTVRPHLDLGLALKAQGKTWSHLSEVLIRMGIPAHLLQDKRTITYPKTSLDWQQTRTHVELDTVLTAAATLAWLRTQGHPGIDPTLASFALLQWWSRHGSMTSPIEQRLQMALAKLQIEISQASAAVAA